MDGFIIDDQTLSDEIISLTDWYTDDIYKNDTDHIIKAGFSRLFCDPERFAEDALEIMSKVGMGVCYETLDDGSPMRQLSAELKNHILDNYYWKHHEKLTFAVENELQKSSRAIIIDCHSFPNIPHQRDINKTPNRPDINIGTDAFHTPDFLIGFTINYFESNGFRVGLNWPFSGALVPMKFYQKNKNVSSILIEINRSLYLAGHNSKEKSGNYDHIKEMIQQYLCELRSVL